MCDVLVAHKCKPSRQRDRVSLVGPSTRIRFVRPLPVYGLKRTLAALRRALQPECVS
jgi:hypothetical protein